MGPQGCSPSGAVPHRDDRDNPEELHVAISEARRWLIEAVSEDPRADTKSPRNLGLALIAQNKAQGYRLDSEYVDVDLATFNDLVAIARANLGSEDALRAVLAAYPEDLLAGEDFSWIRREGVADGPQKKVAWAAITLSRLLQDRHRPQEAPDVLEALLNNIVNDELWIQAMLCEGEPLPRGLGAGDRVAKLHGRYLRHLRACQLGSSDNLEAVYCALLAHDPSAQETR